MKDIDDDTLLGRHLSGDPPRESFRDQTLRDSTAAFILVRRLRCARRRFGLAAAAVLIAGVAFLGGRLSVPPAQGGSDVKKPQHIVQSDSVTVSTELLAWLEAARFFGQLGMQDRMARAVQRAGRLLPVDTFVADGRALGMFAAGAIENREERVELMEISGPHPSAESMNRILAQSFGD